MTVQAKIRPFLMFHGTAEEAMNFYVSLFARSAVTELVRYVPGEAGIERSIRKAVFSLAGQEILCTDSVVQHGFTFTPATSLFVDCDSEEAIQWLFSSLSEKGSVFMPLDNYGFSRKFAWIADRYGVSWQLNLA